MIASVEYVKTLVNGLKNFLDRKFNKLDKKIDTKVDTTRTINGKDLSDDITLTASDVGALPDTTVIPSTDGLASEYYVDEKVTGLATETYVNETVANLVNSAPETLNTLDELAAALGDDENFATTVTKQIAGKVNKVEGKGLSTNDFTTEEKNKLANEVALKSEIPECKLKTVNGESPDENGNAEVTFEGLPDKPFGEIEVETDVLITTIGEFYKLDYDTASAAIYADYLDYGGSIYALKYRGSTEYNGSWVYGNVEFLSEAYYGDVPSANMNDVDTGEPFCFVDDNLTIYSYFDCNGNESIPLRFFNAKKSVKQLDSKYISDDIARVDHTHSYNDLEDKPFGEIGRTIFETSQNSQSSGLNHKFEQTLDVDGETSVLKEGKTYYIEFVVTNNETDDVLYTFKNYSVCTRQIVMMDITALYLEDGQDKFSIKDSVVDNKHVLFCAYYSHEYSDVNIYVSIKENTVKTIDETFIPETIARISDIPEIPIVTTSDAGKFLRVSDTGEWVAETLPFAEDGEF